jgi:DNA-directed RNA polymerase subunit E'/Rpb7
MESVAFFEKKVSLNAKYLNKIGKGSTITDMLQTKLRETLENRCSEHGFVISDSVEIISRSMGYFEPGRFTGDALYYVKAKGRVYYPVDGAIIQGKVLRKNKMGLYVTYEKALRIQIPRDFNLGNEEFESVKIGDTVEVELKKSLFQVNDPYILVNGLFKKKIGGDEEEAEEADEAEEAEEELEEVATLRKPIALEDGKEEDEEEEDEEEDEEEEDEDEEEEDEGEGEGEGEEEEEKKKEP